jgi:hypothetical protein
MRWGPFGAKKYSGSGATVAIEGEKKTSSQEKTPP